MSNSATIPRATARTFAATVVGFSGTETLKLVVGRTEGSAGDIVKALTWDSVTYTSPTKARFTCTLTAANTAALTSGLTYRAVVWRTDSGSEDVPIIDGRFVIVDTPRVS